MKDIFKQPFSKGIRHGMRSLILLFLLGCQNKKEGLVIRWRHEKAIAVALNMEPATGDLAKTNVEVRLAGHKDEPPILGEVTSEDGSVIFSPLIPFTRGLTYEVSINEKFFGTFYVPAQRADNKPSVLAVYPTADTLPENLLKVYIHFSQPMREGQSQKYVHLLNGSDTVHAAFLSLDPELWNEERTILTLWLDPGRIKRNLKPNLQLGAPLSPSQQYRIVISKQWQDQQLTPLTSDWQRTFITAHRDSLSPVPRKWSLIKPKPASSNPLTITFGEPLDHELLLETFSIDDPKGNSLRGTWQPGPGDRAITFIPTGTWKQGSYTVRVSTKLEDLAGNNLNRPFEKNMGNKNPNIERAFIKMLCQL